MMITEQDIGVHKDASEAFEAAKETIVNRIDEVIKVIAKVFHKKISCWWFPNAREGELGDLDNCIVSPYSKDGYDEVCFEMDGGRNMGTDTWDYSCAFPRKFLFMSDHDICAEINNQIKKTEDSAIRKKEKRVQSSAEKKRLKVSVAEKLTKEEKKALGIK